MTWLPYLQSVSVIIGVFLAVYTYLKTAKLKRAEWLCSLYEKFYEEPQYKKIRRILDYKSAELDKIRRGIKGGGDEELLELLVDYLNFFEFIGTLWKMKQLSLNEVRMVFEYYIKRVADFDFLMDYIKNEGFENLDVLIKQLKQK